MYDDNHPAFNKPENENIKIWRFLDFTKFVSLLEKEALFFVNVNHFDDPLEGSYTEADRRYWSNYPENWETMLQAKELVKLDFTVNCWHMNEFESAAMWKLYIKSNEGVAVQSTFKQLTECFKNYSEGIVYIGKVEYKDYNNEETPKFNLFHPFMQKRKSFVHEQELRAVTTGLFPPTGNQKEQTIKWQQRINKIKKDGGLYIPIDLDVLIEKLFISPTAPQWFEELVKSVTEKYNLNKTIIQSSLTKYDIY